MRFNSVKFLIFFPIAVLGYFVLPDKAKNKWLLALSYYFYMCWNAVYAVLIFFSTFSTWACANIISGENATQSKRKFAVLVNTVVNLSILFFFKYYNMFADRTVKVFSLIGITVSFPVLSVLLPVGISFYTFQALGYSLDVYRGTVQHEKNLLNYALFVSFFPQLVAGPIERSNNLLPQFRKYNKFSYENYSTGMRMMLIGFFKKIIIADNISVVLERYYKDLTYWPGPLLVLGIVLFAIQVYCDFSAYSDIARGAAKVMGFELMKNFDHPYFSRNFAEYWSRWHISLSTWFQDYIFTPFVWSNPLKKISKKFSKPPMRTGLLLVFLVSGFWHGAAWTYVVWGLIHAFYRIVGATIAKPKKKFFKKHNIPNNHPLLVVTDICIVFFLNCFSYIFFRSETFSQAWHIIKNSIRGWGVLRFPASFMEMAIKLFGSYRVMWIIILATLVLIIIEIIEIRSKKYFPELVGKLGPVHRWLVYYALLFAIALFGCFEASAFIYFQF